MFRLKFETENAAFSENAAEVERVLAEIGSKVLVGKREGKVHDVNGNAVGSWKWEKEEEKVEVPFQIIGPGDYITADGSKVVLVRHDSTTNSSYVWSGYVAKGTRALSGVLHYWNSVGSHINPNYDFLNIVGPWEEK